MRTTAVVLLTLVTIPAGRAAAQLHEPTSAEHRVLDPAIAAITRLLDQFGDDDWQKSNDLFGGDVLVSNDPDVPLDIDQNFERTYSVRQGSHRWQTVMEPLVRQLQQLTQGGDYAAQRRVGGKIRSLSGVTVDVYINRADFGVDTTVPGLTHVTVKGASLALRSPPDSGFETQGPTYAIGFGAWRGDGPFHFVHGPRTPWIENIVVIVKGADDRIQELLTRIDWAALNGVLTR